LKYRGKVSFSTHDIELCNIPELWKCRECGSRFVQNIVAADTAKKLYSTGQAGDRWPSKTFEEEKTLELVRCITGIAERGGSVLDVGCNTGEFLDFALGYGSVTAGVEFSCASREELRRKGHCVYSALEDVPGKYDVITAFDVVEHLYDVPAFIGSCIEKLSEKGRLVFLTGNIDCVSAKLSGTQWWYAQFPEHVVFPSKRFFFNYSGLRVEEWLSCYPGKWADCPKYKGFISMLNGLLRRGAYTGLPSPFPDHVLIVLRKNYA
jgi:SAM-dependent methyltransferase